MLHGRARPRAGRPGGPARARSQTHAALRRGRPWSSSPGCPGSGKSTLIRRVVALHDAVRRIDSQDTRDRWDARCRAGCRTPSTARSSASRTTRGCAARCAPARASSCTTAARQAWVRRWLGQRRAAGGGAPCTCVLLDVPPETALRGPARARPRCLGLRVPAAPQGRAAADRGRGVGAAAARLRVRRAAGPGCGRRAARAWPSSERTW